MKTKLFLLIIFIITLFSCSNPEQKIPVNDSSFLALFPSVDFDTLHIYSPNKKRNGNKFGGVPIDKEFYRFFVSYDDYLKSWLDHDYHIFSCYKFKISENTTGLIARIPSQYEETAIALYIWDNKAKKIIKRIILADTFGDEDWHFVQDAWLTDFNKDGQHDIIVRKKDLSGEDVDAGKVHITDSVYTFQATGDDFKKINISVDTSKFKLLDWPKY